LQIGTGSHIIGLQAYEACDTGFNHVSARSTVARHGIFYALFTLRALLFEQS
jgi:hypothetical protein